MIMLRRQEDCLCALTMPGKKNDEVTLLSRPTALASSSTERMSDARGLCIHMVPAMQHITLLS